MKIKNLLFVLLAFFVVLPASSQLRKPFRSESSGVRYVQLPVSEQKYRKAEVAVTQKAVLGEKTAAATEKVAGAASKLGIQIEDETGSFSDKTIQSTVDLIPGVFPADKELFVEVLFYEKTKIKEDGLQTKFLDGADVEVKVEYNIYSMPGKTQIESHGPYWLAGKSVTKTAGPNQSRENSYKDRVHIASEWAKAEIMRKYAMQHAYTKIDVYTIRSLSEGKDKVQNAAQEKFLPLLQQFRTKQGTEDYKKEVKACIAMWEDLLKGYKPEAEINDDNVFTLYYNLAAAHYLIGNLNKANEYVKKGIEATKIPWEEVTNRNGEVIGRKRVGIIHATEDIFHTLKADMTAYYQGLKAHDPNFINLVTSDENIQKLSRTIRSLAVNLNLSQIVGLDYPVPIVDVKTKESPKQVIGEITKEGKHLANYTIKDAIIGNKKRVKITNNEGAFQAKLNLSGYWPTSYYEFDYFIGDGIQIGIPSRIVLGKLKDESGRAAIEPAKVTVTWDANVIITNTMIQDRWIYLNYVGANENDALKTFSSTTLVELKEVNEITSFEMEVSTIERDRELGFGGFFSSVGAKMSQGLYDFTETSNDSYKLEFNQPREQEVIEKDNKENWTKLRCGEVVLSRSLIY